MRWKLQLESGNGPESGEASTESPRWYTDGLPELNRAAKFLAQLRAEVQANGDLHLEKQKDLIVTVFGNDFYNSLTEWGPILTVEILGSEQCSRTRKGSPLPASVVLLHKLGLGWTSTLGHDGQMLLNLRVAGD